ncbi:MAG: symmetrical bis(5'-nucleosyl)-tetraphosphatase [Janthinobacterium lividum]
MHATSASSPAFSGSAGRRPIFGIGDLQGCHDAFLRLLDEIDGWSRRQAMASAVPAPADGRADSTFDTPFEVAPAAQAPRLWLTGDLINRGPASLATLRTVMALGPRASVVLGNHDLHLLGVAAGVREMKRGDTIAEILKAPDADSMIDWLRHQPLARYENGLLMIHAGVPPQWDVAATLARAAEVEDGLRSDDWRSFMRTLFGNEPAQWHDGLSGEARHRAIVNALTRLRFCDAEGRMELRAKGGLDDAPPGCMPWFKVPTRATRNVTTVFGHWAALGLRLEDNLCALDSGCVWGNALSAVRLDVAPAERTILQVRCAPRIVSAPASAITHLSTDTSRTDVTDSTPAEPPRD